MVFDRVKEIIVDELGVDAEAVTIESTLEDLGADSLDAVELIMALEEEYDLEISEEDAKNFKTVKSIVAYIESTK
ncbi:MAG: acyl carrier protein [Turicibacter sp.]